MGNETSIALTCSVMAVTDLSVNTVQVSLQAADDVAVSYLAGQYLKLELPLDGDGAVTPLFYSIANRPNPMNPGSLEIFIYNGSELASRIIQYLRQLTGSHEQVTVTLPMGKAYLQTDVEKPHLLVAAGSGITKIRCIAAEIVARSSNAQVDIYWSNRLAEDFYLLDEFQQLGEQYPNLSFTPILESVASGWSGRTGYIYQVIEQDFDSLHSTRTYLCGSPNMVYGTIDQLSMLGLSEDSCYSDVFEYAPRQQSVAV